MLAFRFAVTVASLGALAGCTIGKSHKFCPAEDCIKVDKSPSCGPAQLTQASVCTVPCVTYGDADIASPLDIDEATLSSDRVRELSLEECIQIALANSTIIRDLGGTVLRSPNAAIASLDPALAYTDPRVGEEAALSAFDANLFVNNSFEHNDRGLNNAFFGENGLFRQNLNVTQVGLNKRSATGGVLTLRNVTTYDRNNQLSNRFPLDSSETFVEAGIRQPLLQGAGTEFNRIAGPGATPGAFNGILLSRIRTDISLVDFEQSVRDLLADVENAYWDLYFSYRDLEAKIDVRDIAQDTLDRQPAELTAAGAKAQAEEQVYRLEAEIVDAINGRPLDSTRTNNGSTGGTFRGFGGLRVCERRLRLIIGLPINDGMLIRTTDSPFSGPMMYDWNVSLAEALQHRTELKRQKWVIKQRELELIANRNFLRPQLDLVTGYRARGFGQNLVGTNSATSSLWDNEFQEWNMGLEYNLPVGLRRAHAAVQNSKLNLVRETELLKEQERFVQFGLSNAVSECKRAYENILLQRKRLEAIVTQLNAIESKSQSGENPELDVRLETHRRLLDARIRYHQAEVEYAISLRNVNLEKGTLLEYCNVSLAEGAAKNEAYAEAAEKREAFQSGRSPAVRDQVIATGFAP